MVLSLQWASQHCHKTQGCHRVRTWHSAVGVDRVGAAKGRAVETWWLGTGKLPGKCSWKAVPELLEDTRALSKKRLESTPAAVALGTASAT